MCGLTGILAKSIDKEKLQSATSLLAHRGPDDSGIYIDKHCGLGHRRLSIIDLSSAAKQPMVYKQFIIVYNGEIYNYKELKEELESKPHNHHFKTTSDTEVLLHLFAEYGEQCIEWLNGMFAFAIWDSKKERLFIARDRAGIKPLYYYQDKDKFIFASEIKSLFELGAKKELNKNILADFFNYQIQIGNETLFKGIYTFPQAHCGYIHSQDNYEFNEYWHLEYKEEERTPEELKEILTSTVQRQMVSDVPVGTFLSGGLDSSIITAIAAKIYSQQCPSRIEASSEKKEGMLLSTGLQVRKLPSSTADSQQQEKPLWFESIPGGNNSRLIGRKNTLGEKSAVSPAGTKLKTFTAGFSGYEEEINNAEAASQSLGTEHHSITITPRMFVDALPELIYQYDQPISFASSVALYYVSKLASDNGVKVILTGEGADELFAGYSRYYRLYDFMYKYLGQGLFPYLKGLPFKIVSKLLYDPRYLKNVELIMNGNNYDYLTGVNSIIGEEQQKYLLKSSNKNKNHPLRGEVKRLYNEKDTNVLNKLLYLDWHTYLQELLTKQDRMSMSASIESRVPFLDNEVIDYANSLSPGLKLFGKTGKYILRLMAKDILPEEIIKRKKIGFTVPLDEWFRGPLYSYLQKELNDPIVYEFFGQEYVTTLLEQQKKHNCSLQLWAMLNLKLWHQIYFKQ